MSQVLPPNPWVTLPIAPPFVLVDDAPMLELLNATAKEENRYDLTLLPEPYFGRPDAPVVVLALNPGWSSDDAAVHTVQKFQERSRQSLRHEHQLYPFMHLSPDADTPGARWWRRIVKEPINHLGMATVSRNLLCIEYFPYHSRTYRPSKILIPSQQYSFALVRAAIARGADIVLMRSRKLWIAAVPELKCYARLHELRNCRNPTLSVANLAGSFNIILSRLNSNA